MGVKINSFIGFELGASQLYKSKKDKQPLHTEESPK